MASESTVPSPPWFSTTMGGTLEGITQWMTITNWGLAAKVLLDIGSALKSGTSLQEVLECLRGI